MTKVRACFSKIRILFSKFLKKGMGDLTSPTLQLRSRYLTYSIDNLNAKIRESVLQHKKCYT